MNAMWRSVVIVLALIISICTAFHVSPATSLARTAAERQFHSTQPDHVSSATWRAYPAAGARQTTSCRASMTAQGPGSSKSAQRVATVAGLTSVAILTGSAVPAHAENFAQYFAQGVVGAINGPGILAIPIILGFGLASAVAFFIYFFSQPREYDD